MATEKGRTDPVGYGVAAEKVPPPLPSKTEIVPAGGGRAVGSPPILAVTRSSRPSPFRSPMATELGLIPVGEFVIEKIRLIVTPLHKLQSRDARRAQCGHDHRAAAEEEAVFAASVTVTPYDLA